MLESDVERPFVRAFPGDLDMLLCAAAGQSLDELGTEARAALAAEGFENGEVHLEVDLRFEGQDSELVLPLDRAALTSSGLAALAEKFRAEYRRLYAYESDEPVEVVNLRATGRGVRAKALDMTQARLGLTSEASEAATRSAWMDDGAALRVPVFSRAILESPFEGPLIVEAYDTTVIVPPGWRGGVDPRGNLILEPA
jgi:N-methylhydantoinase A